MTGRRWIACAAAVAGWIGLGVGTALGAALPPVNQPPGAVVTLSILQGGADVADTYLPEVTIDPLARNVTGKEVTLQVNGLAGAVISLQASTAYSGTCTNFSAPMLAGQSSDTNADGSAKPDFTLVGSVLTSLDCGGTATLEVTGGGNTYIFRRCGSPHQHGPR